MTKDGNTLAYKSRNAHREAQAFLEKYGEEISAKLKVALSRHHPEVDPERVSLTVDKFMRHEFPLELEKYFSGLTDKFDPSKHRKYIEGKIFSPGFLDRIYGLVGEGKTDEARKAIGDAKKDTFKHAVVDELSHRSYGLGTKPPPSASRYVERAGDVYTSKPQSVVNLSKERWERQDAEEGELEDRPLEYHEFEELLEKERDALAAYMDDPSSVGRRGVEKAKKNRMKGELLLEEAYPELFDENHPLNVPKEEVKLTEDEKLDNQLASYIEKIQDAASSGDDATAEHYVERYNEVAAKHGRPLISDSRIPSKGMTHVGRLGSFLSGGPFRIGE